MSNPSDIIADARGAAATRDYMYSATLAGRQK